MLAAGQEALRIMLSPDVHKISWHRLDNRLTHVEKLIDHRRLPPNLEPNPRPQGLGRKLSFPKHTKHRQRRPIAYNYRTSGCLPSKTDL